jgi:lipopolysaccharide transport system permease protein
VPLSGYGAGWHISLLPVFVALAMLASLGPAFLIIAFNVKYRDFRYVIHHPVRALHLAGRVFERDCAGALALLLQPEPNGSASLTASAGASWAGKTLFIFQASCSVSVVALFLWLGIAYFRRTERGFADLI